MNIKFNKQSLLLCIELFGIVNFPLSASTIDTDELVRTISDSYNLPTSVNNFEKLLDKLDDLRHCSERKKRTALDIYSDISDNHLYLGIVK